MRLLRCLFALACVLGVQAAEAVVVKLAKRGNIRYGPSLNAPVAVTLSAGTEVTLLAAVTGADGQWYQIRFPAEGKAWMHEQVLRQQPDGTYVVTEDKARVRDDATLGGNIVAELSAGDIVEDRGRKVGQWVAVYPRNAVAYASGVLFDLKQPEREQVVADNVKQERASDALWLRAKQTFIEWTAVNDLQRALTYDWSGLSAQFATVAKEHERVGIRIDAQRLKDQVDAVAREQKRLGAAPTVRAPEPTAQPAPQPVQVQPRPQPVAPQPVAQQPQPQPQPQPVAPQPVAPQPQPAPAPQADPIPEPTPEVAALMGDQAAIKPTGGFAAEGFLIQRGVDHFITDRSSRLVAQIKPNGNLQLSDYFWREVGIKGQPQGTVAVDGAQVPVLLVDDVVLLNR